MVKSVRWSTCDWSALAALAALVVACGSSESSFGPTAGGNAGAAPSSGGASAGANDVNGGAPTETSSGMNASGASGSDGAGSPGVGTSSSGSGGSPDHEAAGSGGSGGANAGTSAGGTAGSTTGGGSGSAGTSGGAYDPCPATGTPCRIMPLGDSITEGYRSSAPGGGYRPPLFHLALQDRKSVTFVGTAPLNGPDKVDGVTFPKQNEGVGGRTIGAVSSIVVDSMQKTKPNIILLGIGTNDLSYDAPATMAKNLGNLLDKIISADPNVLLVVAQIIPCKTASINKTIEAYDALIPGLVKTRRDAGKHVLTVDMYTAFTSNSNYTSQLLYDTYHPRDAGYSVMATVWCRARS